MTPDARAALAAALHDLEIDCPTQRRGNRTHDEIAAAILAALDGWTLVPTGTIEGHRVCEENMDAEIARLRAALERIADEEVSETLGWDDGDYRIRDRRVARAALAPSEP